MWNNERIPRSSGLPLHPCIPIRPSLLPVLPWMEFSPAYYEALPVCQVDWASLAQEWIALKGGVSPSIPPPPHSAHSTAGVAHSLSSTAPPTNPYLTESHLHPSEDLGEANMDLEEDEPKDESSTHLLPPILPSSLPPILPSSLPPLPSSPIPSSSFSSSSLSSLNKKHAFPPPSPLQYSSQVRRINGTTIIDASARKKLPPWIREGLEKMEKEKLKKEAAERQEQLKEEREKRRTEELEKRLKMNPSLSKFDDNSSTSENENENEDTMKEDETLKNHLEKSTDIEAEADLAINIRKIMTEILLEVTEEEMRRVAKDILEEKALKKEENSSLLLVCNGYGSDSSSENDSCSNNRTETDSIKSQLTESDKKNSRDSESSQSSRSSLKKSHKSHRHQRRRRRRSRSRSQESSKRRKSKKDRYSHHRRKDSYERFSRSRQRSRS